MPRRWLAQRRLRVVVALPAPSPRARRCRRRRPRPATSSRAASRFASSRSRRAQRALSVARRSICSGDPRRRQPRPVDAARQHARAGALVARPRSCSATPRGDAPFRRPRRADARGARREPSGRGAVRLAARPAVARRAERVAARTSRRRASSSWAGRRPRRASTTRSVLGARATAPRAAVVASGSASIGRERWPSCALRRAGAGQAEPVPARRRPARRRHHLLHSLRADRLVRHAALRARAPTARSRRHDLGAALPADDLCLRAARALQAAPAARRSGADITVDKRIPGAPAWAAAAPTPPSTLLALNRLWEPRLAAGAAAADRPGAGRRRPVLPRRTTTPSSRASASG